ncbi:hypothetical protein VNO77_06078 [Canavalia gladiata]|uniref:Uncharacterized protein n=1 Tax=Canavalia gladiata TaxID=3824 RepID=A0AAN9N092_CANGL
MFTSLLNSPLTTWNLCNEYTPRYHVYLFNYIRFFYATLSLVHLTNYASLMPHHIYCLPASFFRRLIHNPITNPLPVNVFFENSYVSAANCDDNLVFVVAAMAHYDYIHDLIDIRSIPDFRRTDQHCIREKLEDPSIALERNWKIQ